jgi:hypothetical protein
MYHPIRRMKLVALLTIAFAASSVGCSSIRSTLFAYDGCQDCTRDKLHLHGVPTTLTVPTHLQVTVTRVRWGKVDGTGAVIFAKDLETQLVDITPITQQEIFTVDFKRPASGTLSYKLTLDKQQQYITGIDNEVEDTTIKDIAGLVAAVLKAVPVRAQVREVAPDGTNLSPFPEVIASELFEISEPELQNRVEAFLAKYVNDCAGKCPPCTFPGPSPRCASCLGTAAPPAQP